MLVGAYWKQRRESVDESAAVLFRILMDLKNQVLGEEMNQLKGLGPNGEPLPVPLDGFEALIPLMRPNTDEPSGQPSATLGQQFVVGTDGDLAIRGMMGITSKWVTNSIAVELDLSHGPPSEREEQVLQILIAHLRPEHATITDDDRILAANGKPVWECGWRNYPGPPWGG